MKASTRRYLDRALKEGLFASYEDLRQRLEAAGVGVKPADLAFAHLPAPQLQRILREGGRLEITATCVKKSKNLLRRGFIHLDFPLAVNAFLQASLNPGFIAGPAWMQQHQLVLPQQLIIFGFFHGQNGDFFISNIAAKA